MHSGAGQGEIGALGGLSSTISLNKFTSKGATQLKRAAAITRKVLACLAWFMQSSGHLVALSIR